MLDNSSVAFKGRDQSLKRLAVRVNKAKRLVTAEQLREVYESMTMAGKKGSRAANK